MIPPPRSADIHDCGGTIHAETQHAIGDYRYCSWCGAFQWWDAPGTFPRGTDRLANGDAWDAGDARSPDAPDGAP